MDYYTCITGSMEIQPPLTYAEVKRWREQFKNGDDRYASVRLQVVKEPVETDQGVLERITGVAFVAYEEAFKAGDFVSKLNEAISMFAVEGRRFTGGFDAEGESARDMWRVRVNAKTGRVQTVMVWPVWPEDLDRLREAWQTTFPTGNAQDDHDRLSMLRAAVTELLDRAHRAAAKDVES